MTTLTDNLYQHAPAIWTPDICRRESRHRHKDGYGTPFPFRGYYTYPYHTRYWNGGIVIEGKLWPGEYFPFPQLAEGYAIMRIPTWGYRLVNLENIFDPQYVGEIVHTAT